MATPTPERVEERTGDQSAQAAPLRGSRPQAPAAAVYLGAGAAAHQAALALQSGPGNRALARLLGRSAPAIQRYVGPIRVASEPQTEAVRRGGNPASTANYATLFIADAGQANWNRTHTVASVHQTGVHAERLLVQWAGANGVALNVPPGQTATTRATALYTELSPCVGCDALLTQQLHAQIPVTYTATYMPPHQYSQMLLIRRTQEEVGIRAAYAQRMPQLPLNLKGQLALVFQAALADLRGVDITDGAMLVAATNNALPAPPIGVPLGHARGAWRIDAYLALRGQHWRAQIHAVAPPPGPPLPTMPPSKQPPPPGPQGQPPVFA